MMHPGPTGPISPKEPNNGEVSSQLGFEEVAQREKAHPKEASAHEEAHPDEARAHEEAQAEDTQKEEAQVENKQEEEAHQARQAQEEEPTLLDILIYDEDEYNKNEGTDDNVPNNDPAL